MKKVKVYRQGRNLTDQVQAEIKGRKALVLLGDFQYEQMKQKVTQSLRIPYICVKFVRDVTIDEINALATTVRNEEIDTIIALGGGKILDVAKAITHFTNSFLLLMPSSASMDGACSALSVLYHEDGALDRYLYLDHNPNVVLVDTTIIFEAPKRLLVAGMGDALATYFETRAYHQKYQNILQEIQMISRHCYDELLKYGKLAIMNKQDGIHSDAVDNIIRVNLYDSCIGFENGGLSIAHAFNNALTKLEKNTFLHGESVALGLLVQLSFEQAREYSDVLHFMKQVGLPISLKSLCLTNMEKKNLITGVLQEEGIQNHRKSLDEKSLWMILNPMCE